MVHISQLLKQITVNQIILQKGNQVWSTSPDVSVFEALQEMAEKNVGALIVTREDEIVGILSERDYARKVILHGKSSMDTLVREIMTERVICVGPEHTVADCMALMTDKHIRHLPVLEDERIVGIISIGDAVKAIISEQEFVIEQLENYILGERS